MVLMVLPMGEVPADIVRRGCRLNGGFHHQLYVKLEINGDFLSEVSFAILSSRECLLLWDELGWLY